MMVRILFAVVVYGTTNILIWLWFIYKLNQRYGDL